MFKAYINSGGEAKLVVVYQILQDSSFPSGYKAIYYDFKEFKWGFEDLDAISPTITITSFAPFRDEFSPKISVLM